MIEVKQLTKMYGNLKAVDNLSFDVEKGEILGLLGPNGAGKTTTMRILTCFLPATVGTATVAGFDIFEDSIEIRRRIGYLPETPPLYPEMTVTGYLEFMAGIREVPFGKISSRLSEVLERTGLTDHRSRIVGTLSKGYRQRVGLAQALIHDPEVLILDEPTVGLDPNQIIEIRDLIQNLSKNHTVILSTHILSEVQATCNRVAIINEGRLVAVDSVERLISQGEVTLFKVALKPASANWQETFKSVQGVDVTRVAGEGQRVTFDLRVSNPETYEKLFAVAVGKGHIFTEITPAKASLEEVFRRLTKGDQPENGGTLQ